MSEESLKRGLVSRLERLMRSKTDLFGGPFNARPGWWLHSGRSGGTLSVGPELIMKIPDGIRVADNPFRADAALHHCGMYKDVSRVAIFWLYSANRFILAWLTAVKRRESNARD